MVDFNFDDDDSPAPQGKAFDEFDCPDCNANNPYPDGFRGGSEVLCYYCGNTFKVVMLGESRFKLKEV